MENVDITLENIEISNVSSVLTGPQGPAGFSPIATVSKTGGTATITITDENGTTTAQVTDGTNGLNNTLAIGTVSSGATASATITGDSPNQTLNLVLPKGDTGSAGADGVTPTFSVGTVSTLPAGSPATVENSGSGSNIILDFGIPQGIQGSSANALSMPTVVNSLPVDGTPGVFYFVPKAHTLHTGTGDSFTVTISEDAGSFDTFVINGVLEQATPPATIYVMTGVSTITIGADTYTIDLGDIELAKVQNQKDYIYNDGDVWKLHKVIGKIESYSGETITTDYVSTSGSLTNGDTVYYILDTPVTTTITNETLINSLNMVLSYEFETGTTAVSITNADVTPDLTTTYYEYDPLHQYDKYVYLIESGGYEQIG